MIPPRRGLFAYGGVPGPSALPFRRWRRYPASLPIVPFSYPPTQASPSSPGLFGPADHRGGDDDNNNNHVERRLRATVSLAPPRAQRSRGRNGD